MKYIFLLLIAVMTVFGQTGASNNCTTECVGLCEPKGSSGSSYNECVEFCNKRCGEGYPDCNSCYKNVLTQCAESPDTCKGLYYESCGDACPRECDGFSVRSVTCNDGTDRVRETFTFCLLPMCDVHSNCAGREPIQCYDGTMAYPDPNKNCVAECPSKDCENAEPVVCADGSTYYPTPNNNCVAKCPEITSCELQYIQCADGTVIRADPATCVFHERCPIICTEDLVRCPYSTDLVRRDPNNNCGPDMSLCPQKACTDYVKCPNGRLVPGNPEDCSKPLPGLCECEPFAECPENPEIMVPVDLRTCNPLYDFCRKCNLPPYECADGTQIERDENCIPIRPCPVSDCEAKCATATGVDNNCLRECTCRQSSVSADGTFDDYAFRMCNIKFECEKHCSEVDMIPEVCMSQCLCQYGIGNCGSPTSCKENCNDDRCVAKCECDEACSFLDHRDNTDGDVASSSDCRDKCYCSKFPEDCKTECNDDCVDVCAVRHPNDPVRYKECWCNLNPGLCEVVPCTGDNCAEECDCSDDDIKCKFLCICPRTVDECRELSENIQQTEFTFSGTLDDCSQDVLDEFLAELEKAIRECSIEEGGRKRALAPRVDTDDLNCHDKCTLVGESRRIENSVCYDECYRDRTNPDACLKCDEVRKANDEWLISCYDQCNDITPVPDCVELCEDDHIERNAAIDSCREKCKESGGDEKCFVECERLQVNNDILYKQCLEGCEEDDTIEVTCYQECELKLVPQFEIVKKCYQSCPAGGCGCEEREKELRMELQRCYNTCAEKDTVRECMHCDYLWISDAANACIEACATADRTANEIYDCQRSCKAETERLVTGCREECAKEVKDLVEVSCFDICRALPTYETCIETCDSDVDDCSAICSEQNDKTRACFDRCYQQTDCAEGDTSPNCCKSRCAGDEECHRVCMSQYIGDGFTCLEGVFEASRQFSSVIISGNREFIECVESKVHDAAERLNITPDSISVEVLYDGNDNSGSLLALALISVIALLF